MVGRKRIGLALIAKKREQSSAKVLTKEPLGLCLERKNLSSFGGLELFSRYLRRVELSRRVGKACRGKGIRSDYGSVRLVLVLVGMLLVGARRLEQAKQFTSDLVFGKQVRIEGKERDRYGRLVARVLGNGTDVALALVEAGLAWHYKQYSSDQVLAAAEIVAREKKIGVWSLPNPVAPWDHRSGVASGNTSGPYHGNSRSKVYHAQGCQYFDCKNCTVNLASKETAASQGFRPHERCVGVAGSSQASSPTSAASSATASTSASSTTYHGNKKSKVYHAPGCRYYSCKNCTVSLARKVRPHRRDFVRTRDAEGAYGSVRRNMGGRSCDN